MGKSIRLFKIKDIPIELHPSWFIIFVFVTWSLASGYFSNQAPGLPAWGMWALGLVTSLLFFSSVLAHELGHTFVAVRSSIKVKSITLFFLGGLAQIEREPDTPGEEFRIAIAGPMVSLALALGFSMLGQINSAPYLDSALNYLGRINLLLGLFNLIPGFPMDGGRILRAIIWKLRGSFYQATRAASVTGQIIAGGFIAYGAYSVFNGNFGNGMWLGFIGLFLFNAAGSANMQARMREKLKGVVVDQIMNRDYPTVPGDVTLDRLVLQIYANNNHGTFLVLDEGTPIGILSVADIRKVPRHTWNRVRVKEVMKPWDLLVPVNPGMPVLTALQKMDSAEVSLVPVVDGLQVKGVLSRDQVSNYLRLRTELG